MRKGFRRLLVLVMVIATVCLLSTSALASGNEDDNFNNTNYYDNNRITATTHGDIWADGTSGSIVVNNPYYPNMNYVSIEVTYHFYTNDISQAAKTKTNSAGNLFGTANVSNYATDDIFVMVDATYNVYAEFTTSYGPEKFDPNPFYIRYDPTNP